MRNSYYLISKKLGQSFVKYKGNAIRLSGNLPYSVDEVVVGVKGKIGNERKITTFRDSNGKILEQAFDFYDKPYRNIIYTHEDHVLNDENFVTSTTMKTYTLKRNILNVYNEFKDYFRKYGILTTLWTPQKSITNHLCENINTGEKVLSQVCMTNLKQPTKNIHSFIEYPHIIDGKRNGDSKKILSFEVNSKENTVNKKHSITENVKFPKNDTFLALRAYGINDAKEIFTEFFIKNENLKKLNLSIDTNYNPQTEKEEKQLIAFFSWSNGSINFNKHYKLKSKEKLFNTVRHEIEHAYQFFLDARNTYGKRTEWQKLIYDKFGSIKNAKLKKEADIYTKSIDNYVFFDEDFARYKKNYIEIKANRAGLLAKNRYNRQGRILKESFPYIPEELL